MITNIHLGNFKAFAETQKIPIKPLTLIFGPNSAGKSSIIHGIALAHEGMNANNKDGLDIKQTVIGGEAIDLGGFRQYVHRRDQDVTVEWGIELDAQKFSGRIAELLAPVKNVSISILIGRRSDASVAREKNLEEVFDTLTRRPSPDEEIEVFNEELTEKEIGQILKETYAKRHGPLVRTCDISCDGRLLMRISQRAYEKYTIDRLDTEHPVIEQIFGAISAFYSF